MSDRTPPRYGTAWILFFLVTTGVGFFVGLFVGGLAGVALTLLGLGPTPIKFIAGVLGFLIGIPISYFTFRWVVAEYIVKPLVAAAPAAEPPPIAGLTAPSVQEPPTAPSPPAGS